MTVLWLALIATGVMVISAAVHHWAVPRAIAALIALGTVWFVAFGQTTDDAGVIGIAIIDDLVVGLPLVLVSSAGVVLGEKFATRSRRGRNLRHDPRKP